ncbi:unnamed protein product, partial [Protopolystoma xenopodis]
MDNRLTTVQNDSTNSRRLAWLWFHPAAHTDISSRLNEVLHHHKILQLSQMNTNSSEHKREEELQLDATRETEENELTNGLTNDFNSSILRITDRTGRLCRVRLLGRQAHQLLVDIIKPYFLSPASNLLQAGSTIGMPTITKCSGDWSLWQQELSDCQEASCLPAGTVISLPGCDSFLAN